MGSAHQRKLHYSQEPACVSNISRALRTGAAQPLTCVKRTKEGPNKEVVGTYTMDPMEIDDSARTVCGKVYKEVTKQMHHTALNFMKHMQHTFTVQKKQ